jgi:hypothetical protein
MRPDAIRDAGLRELGAHARLRKIAIGDNGQPRPYEERCKLFDAYKAELKKTHRSVALECHPDRNLEASEEDRAKKETRFKRVTSAVDFLMTLAPRPPAQPQPQMHLQHMAPPGARIIIINLGGQPLSMGNFRWPGGTVQNTTTASSNYWPWHD